MHLVIAWHGILSVMPILIRYRGSYTHRMIMRFESGTPMRLFLLAVLAAISPHVSAEWMEVTETDTATFYIDPTTIRKDGEFRRVWQLQDMKGPRGDGAWSQLVLYEYDCKLERDRLLASSFHSRGQGKGSILSSNNELGQWEYVPPRTAASIFLKVVCAK